MVSRTSTRENRIFFPGNPWENGHALEEFDWSGRLTPEGFFFDFNVVSADYDAEDEDEEEDEDEDEEDDDDTGGDGDDEDEDQMDWEAKIVWYNYHACILSSTYWGYDANGVLVTDNDMVSLEKLASKEFQADPLPIEDWDEMLAFNVYLLGHDTVADHSIRFGKRTAPFTYSIDWKGKVALTYSGDDEFDYTFELLATNAKLSEIAVFDLKNEKDATARLKQLVKEAEQFKYVVEDKQPKFVLA